MISLLSEPIIINYHLSQYNILTNFILNFFFVYRVSFILIYIYKNIFLRWIKTKKLISDFIEVYRRHLALWNTKSDLSKNKHLRTKSIEELIKVCQGKCNGADEAFVKRKINNLRTAFRRELHKVGLSKITGTSAEDIYVISLWYFNLMSFTTEDETGRLGISSLDDNMEFKVSNLFSTVPIHNKLI